MLERGGVKKPLPKDGKCFVRNRVAFDETVIYSPFKVAKVQSLKECLVQSATFEVCNGKTLMKAKKHVLQNGTTGLKNPVEGNIPSLE